MRACERLRRRQGPDRVRVRSPECAVVGEDLDVVEPVPARGVERREDPGHVGLAVAGPRTIGPTAGRLPVVADVDTDEAIDLSLDVLVEALGVPEMPDVELDPGRRRIPRVANQL